MFEFSPVFIQYIYHGVTDALTAERSALTADNILINNYSGKEIYFCDARPSYSKPFSTHYVDNADHLNKKKCMLKLYQTYLQQPRAQAVIDACYDFSDAEKTKAMTWFNETSETSLLIFSKSDKNTCMAMLLDTFDALRKTKITDYENQMQNIYLFRVQQEQNGKFNAVCEPTSTLCLDEKYAKEFPFLAMTEEFKLQERARVEEEKRQAEFTIREEPQTVNVLKALLATASSTLREELLTKCQSAMGYQRYTGALDDQGQIALSAVLASEAYSTQDSRTVKLNDAFYEKLMLALLGKATSHENQRLMLLSLSALFSHLSSSKGLGTEYDSALPFRLLCDACLTKLTELEPAFLPQKIINWQDKLNKRNGTFDCTDILTTSIIQTTKLECEKASRPLLRNILPAAWRG